MRFDRLRQPDLRSAATRIFVVPLGSLEQHGRHLPLLTDSMIVTRVAERVERECEDETVLLPTQWLGHSPHHRRFGCVSLDQMPYIAMVCGICRSLVALGARRILLLNGHGGNDVPCRAALRELKTEFEAVRDLYIVFGSYWDLAAAEFAAIRESPPGGMGHACEMETSVVLSLAPELVDLAAASPGGPAPETGRVIDMQHGRPYYIVNEFDEISENGVIGMPAYAAAEKGDRFLDAAVAGVVRFLKEFAGWRYQTP